MLEERSADGGLTGLALSFFAKAAEIVANPWTLSGSVDLAFAKTQGERPPQFKEQIAYMAAFDALTAEDAELNRLLWEVLGLCKPVSVLNEEPLQRRVVAELRKHPDRYGS